MAPYQKPRPRISPDNDPAGSSRVHRLMLQTSGAYGEPHLPPGPVCPFSFSESEIVWQAASGRGQISTWTMVHKAWFQAFKDETPYFALPVELDEGPRQQ